MMRLIIAALALALGACTAGVPGAATPGTTPGPVAQVIARADTVILSGERAFAVAELAYITAADGVGKLADNGLITGERATWVRARNAEARALLVRGKATADATVKARAAADLLGIAGRLDTLIKGM